MADIARMESALRNAHNAGDAAAAKAIANALKAARAGGQQQSGNMAELSAMSQGFGAPQQEVNTRVRANLEATKINDMRGQGALGASAAKMVPFSDEIYSGTVGAAARMMRDGVGYGEAYNREMALQGELDRRRRDANPIASTVGDIAGGVALAGSLPSLTAKAAGSSLLARTGAGAAEGAAYGALYGADEAEQGSRLSGAVSGAATGAALGGAVPVIGAGLRKGYGAIRSTTNPTAEAASRVRDAMQRDAGRVAVGAGDELAAKANNQPLLNVDRGGETTRALARASANVSPEARATLQRVTSDRFGSQSDRAVEIIKRVSGGAVDDLAAQDGIRSAARAGNKAAYERAYSYNFGKGHPVELDALQSRVPAKAVRDALSIAKAEGRPFGEQLILQIDDATDTVSFRRAPSMREWDYIQRGLRNSTDNAFRSGNGAVGTAYKELRSELLGVLDGANPYFKQARAGASAAFGAEDAIEAGRNFAKVTRNTPEMARAVAKMNEAEKKAFRTGFASELIDKVKSTRDRANVIDSMFNRPEAREKMILAFGEPKARQIEAFVRIESGMDLMRNALGNSTTARQLVELGLVGGGNTAAGLYGFATGDWRAASLTAAATGLKYGRAKVDQRVMEKIAELLVSNDKAALDRVINNATMSKSYMNALRVLTDGMLRLQGPVAGMAGAKLVDQ